MATESETTWTNLLKIMFLPGNLEEALPDSIMFYKWMQDQGNIVPYGGQEIRFPVKDQRQAGVGAVATGSSSLPTATISNALIARFNARYVYGVGELDDMVMKVSRDNQFAYEQAGEQVREDLLLSLKMILQAAWYDDGRARLGVMPGADDQTTITLLQPIHMLKGYRVDLVDATDDSTKLLSGAAISAVDHQGVSGNTLRGTVTVGSAPSGSAANDYFTPENAIDGSGNQLFPFGIRAGCDSANPSLENYGQINRSTSGNEAWQGNKFSNSGTNRAWTVRMANAMLQIIRRRSGGMIKLSDIVIVNNRNIAQEVFETAAPDRQIVVRGKEAMEVAPGFARGSDESFQPYAFLNGVNDMYQDELAPANDQFFLSPSTWHITQTGPPELADEDGSVLHRFEGRPALQFRWRYFHEVYTTSPAANGIIEDLQETNPEA